MCVHGAVSWYESLTESENLRHTAQLGATGNLSSRMTNLAAIEEVRPPSAKLGLPHALGCTGEMLRRVTDLEEGQVRHIMTYFAMDDQRSSALFSLAWRF